MERMRRLAGAVLMGVLALSLAGNAAAQLGQQRQRGQRAGRGMISTAVLAKLNLTAEQQEKMKAAQEAYTAELQKAQALSTPEEQRQASRQARESYQLALQKLLTADQRKQLQELTAQSAQTRGIGQLGTQLAGLNLTEEQQKKVKEITAKYQPEFQKLRASQKQTTDRQAVRLHMRELTTKMMAEVRAVLTPEQQKQLQPAGRRNRSARPGGTPPPMSPEQKP